MPDRDDTAPDAEPSAELSETSGAARKRRKREQAKLDALSGPDDGRWADEFRKAGKPDLDNPELGLAYVRKLQLIVLRQMATTPFPPAAQRECWKRIDYMTKTLGMTHAKASLETKVAALQKMLDARQQAPTVLLERGEDVPRPATARGGSLGPRPVRLEQTADVPDRNRRPD